LHAYSKYFFVSNARKHHATRRNFFCGTKVIEPDPPGYQGDELWTTMNPLSGERQIVDPSANSSRVKQSSSCTIGNGLTAM
jgi:hypothetical protein